MDMDTQPYARAREEGEAVWFLGTLVIMKATAEQTALAAAGNLYFSRRNLDQQRVLNEQQAQDDAIQGYLEQMTNLMFDEAHPLRTSSPTDEVSTLARAHTLTVLRRDALRPQQPL